MSTPEGLIKSKAKKVLKQHGVYWHCPVQNGMGAPSLDFICCFQGRFVAIETKAPGKLPTPRQLLTIAEIEAAEGKVFVIDGDAGCKDLSDWLLEVSSE